MVDLGSNFSSHLKSGVTTLCRCWAIERVDGTVHGFTDHDGDLSFEGIAFRASSGMSALAMQQTTGLSVDNTEAVGMLSDAAIREKDIEAGRFDSARVRSWIVNWADLSMRWLQFRGSIGELRRNGQEFHAELRGLTDVLNQPVGRIYQKPCTAVLGDRQCGLDTSHPGFRVELVVQDIADDRRFSWPQIDGYASGWFSRGVMLGVEGAANGVSAPIKIDHDQEGVRTIELWEPHRGGVSVGDRVLLVAGCDKRFETCRIKFSNLLNFQGFPDIPSEDWMMAVPKRSGENTGGSLR